MPPELESASREDLLALIAALQQQNTALEQQNARQQAEIERLNTRVAELERRLGRNSQNSSLPPSSDTFQRPQGTTPRAAPGRKRGRQPGAPGGGLAMTAAPDEITDHLPDACTGCGAGLGRAHSTGYRRRQVRDIGRLTVTVTEHRAHACACSCGAVTEGALPGEIAACPSSYGPRLRALAAYLLVFQHVPVERAAVLIADVCGARVSTGWVSSILEEAARAVSDSLKLIRALLAMSHVVHADETTTRIGRARRWLHTACNQRLSLLGLAPRSRAGADSLGVLPAFRGTLVHDSLSLYAGYPGARHQLCGAHLIRELSAAEQDHPGQHWHRQIRWALAGLARQAGRVRSGAIAAIAPQKLEFYLRQYHQGVAVGLSSHRRAAGRKQSGARNLLLRLRDNTGQVLAFAERPHLVPFTNNEGEQGLRPVKTQVKISGCHQSEDGAQAWLDVRSYIDSARKHGTGVFEALLGAFTGELWMPPVPASA